MERFTRAFACSTSTASVCGKSHGASRSVRKPFVVSSELSPFLNGTKHLTKPVSSIPTSLTCCNVGSKAVGMTFNCLRKSPLVATLAQLLCGGRFLRDLRTKQQEAGETSALTLDAAGMTIKLPLSLSPKPPIKNRMTPTRAAWLFVSQPTKLDEKQRRHVQDLRAGHRDLETAYDLSQRFVMMLTERRGSDLDAWLIQAKQSGIVELQRFATGLRRDYAAERRLLFSLEQRAGGGPSQLLKAKAPADVR